MNVLLDTHIFLWSLIEPERLTSRHHELLGDRQVQIWLSPITIWECLLLSEKGRVELLPSAPFWLDNAVTRIGAKEAALNSAVALRSRDVSMSHQEAVGNCSPVGVLSAGGCPGLDVRRGES